MRLTVISCKRRRCRIVTGLRCCHRIQPATEFKHRPKLAKLAGVRKHVRSACLLVERNASTATKQVFVLTGIQEIVICNNTMQGKTENNRLDWFFIEFNIFYRSYTARNNRRIVTLNGFIVLIRFQYVCVWLHLFTLQLFTIYYKFIRIYQLCT